ncbi:hypothetical protein LGQ02_19145 [Bacillus shivajii]|uniref:hypothetical protein n=1 Tax=Bacillus shivajii TaxID=1983719 RepID=UPI001CFB6A62|nr:hypothetical protein [Bacillus shivajii]UCZ52871.1 hypothetical protein LGQ02_19145 [Bacillus shivajii]
MKAPFSSRFIKRILLFFGLYFGVLIISNTIFSSIVAVFGMSLSMLLIPGYPLYFIIKRNKDQMKCSSLIREQYQQQTRYIAEAYHPSLEWGYLTLTDSSLIFIPKKGGIMNIGLNNIKNYGSKALGTGDFTTTTAPIGGGIHMSGTSENKSPVFYVEANGETQFWHCQKNSKMFDKVKSYRGDNKPGEAKVNF